MLKLKKEISMFDEVNMKKSTIKTDTLKNAISLCLLFGASLAFAPSAGIIRTFPIVFFGGVFAGFVGAGTIYCTLFSCAMTLCIYLVSARGVPEAVFFALTGAFLTIAGMYFAKLILLFVKTKKGVVRRRAAALAVLFAVASVLLCLILTGNAFGYVKSNKANREYVAKSYGELAEVNYTCFDTFSREYRTYVTFSDIAEIDGKETKIFYGEDDSVYVGNKNGKLNDGVRNYFEEKIKVKAEHDIERIILGSSYGFKVIKSDIDFPNDELVDMSKNYTEYLDRIAYVVNFDSIISKGGRDRFASVCSEALKALKQSFETDGFVYDTIVFCAGDANDVIYSLTSDMNTEPDDAEELICEYDESQTEKYGVSEKDILRYWQNN